MPDDRTNRSRSKSKEREKDKNRQPGRSRREDRDKSRHRSREVENRRGSLRQEPLLESAPGREVNESPKRFWTAIICVVCLLIIILVVVGFVLIFATGDDAVDTSDADTPMKVMRYKLPPVPPPPPVPKPPPQSKEGRSLKFSAQEWNMIRGDCGIPRAEPDLSTASGRIVNGDQAKPHSWSWQISLVKYKDYGGGRSSVQHICGGTLVGPQFVISAAHCFLNSLRTRVTTDPSGYRVIVGGHDKGRPTRGAKLVAISKLIHHPKNNLATFSKKRQLPNYDITVVKLAVGYRPSDSQPLSSFACLPRPGNVPPVKKKCWVTGWGKTLDTGFDKVLKQAPQKIVSKSRCNIYYRKITYEWHLCVEEGDMGTCQGDSGGPLVCQGEDRKWTLYGDTSFGPTPCATKPTVFANVAKLLSWACCYMEDYGPCAKVLCTP